MTCLKNLATALGLLLLAGCSALSPYSTQTKLQLTLDSNEHLNLDVNGRASPLVLRLYELKHPVAFENADFFSLYERGKDVLAQDLVNSEELELRPGQTMDLKLTVAGTSRYVGVMAAYRDITDAVALRDHRAARRNHPHSAGPGPERHPRCCPARRQGG